MLFNLGFYGHKRRWAMVLRPVEFDASRNPWPGQAYERRLNYILPIKEVVSSRLIVTNVNATANLRQNHQSQEVVFKMNRLPLL